MTVEEARALRRDLRAITGVTLSDQEMAYLTVRTILDLGMQEDFPMIGSHIVDLPEIYDLGFTEGEVNIDLIPLLTHFTNHDDYCIVGYLRSLRELYIRRKKWRTILRTQAIPDIAVLSSRILLEYGMMDTAELVSIMRLRKFFFDLDNRLAQETGYTFEPMMANCLGGTSVSHTRSPFGRQIDCLIEGERLAYEMKIRITIAASGQGRWGEELSYPQQAQSAGYIPVLLVFDPTPNPKLTEISQTYLDSGGQVFVGDDAWAHVALRANRCMELFFRLYVRPPLDELIGIVGDIESMEFSISENDMQFLIGTSVYSFPRDN